MSLGEIGGELLSLLLVALQNHGTDWEKGFRNLRWVAEVTTRYTEIA